MRFVPLTVVVACVGILVCSGLSPAQNTCSWGPVGGIGYLGFQIASISALAVYDDGSGPALHAGGFFTAISGVPANYIAKWDGNTWAPLGSGITGSVRALAVFDDGTGPALYVAGANSAGGIPVNSIAKWDGSTWSQLGAGINGTVGTLEVFDDGTGPALYAGGLFTMAGVVPANNIAKWDGASWTPLGSGVNGTVEALTVFDAGTGPGLYAGGQFVSMGGMLASRIARWDGSTWSSVGSGVSAGGTGVVTTVYSLSVFDDGTGPALYAGGGFTTAGALPASHIARWDGSTWSQLGAGISGSSQTKVRALTVFDDGTGPALHAGGDFTSAGSTSVSNIAKWDGNTWSALDSGLWSVFTFPTGTASSVLALIVFDDGTSHALCAAGRFTRAGGVTVSHIAKWNCGSAISLSATQTTPGALVYVNNANLTPGNEYYNLFSVDLCLGGAGAGPFLGLCATTAQNIQFLITQALTPVGTPLTHFLALSSYVNWGPLTLPPVTVDGVCFDFTGGVIGAVSPVARITVQ